MKNETKSKAVKLGAKIILKLTGLELLGEGGSFVYEAGKHILPEATKNLIDATIDGSVDFFSDEAGDYAKNYLTKREKYVNFHLARGISKVWEDGLTASLPKNRAANSRYVLLPQDSFQDFNEQIEFFIAKFKQAQDEQNQNLLIELFYDRDKSEEDFYKTFFEAAQNENAAEEAYWQTLKKTLRRWSIVEGKFRSEWKDDFPEDFSREMKKFLFGNMRIGLKEIFQKNGEFRNSFQFSADLLIFNFVQKLPAQIQEQIENAQSENRFNFLQLQERFSGIENKITAIAEAIQGKFTQSWNPKVFDDLLTESQKQTLLQERIATAAEELVKNKPSEPQPTPLPKHISHEGFPSPTNYFTGRDDVIGNIVETLETHKKATLHGISGLGKTSVALEFAKRFEDSYKNIIFVRATRGDAVGNFARLAETIDETAKNLENDAARARRFTAWLEENSDWLLLIDNVDAPNEVLPLLPVKPRGHILATGNSPTLTVLGNEVEIKKMKSKTGELLLYRRAKTLSGLDDEEIKTRLQNETEAEQTAVKNLVKEFDGLPLALNLAGAYIHGFDKNFAGYENLYRKSAPQLLAAQDINDQYQNNSVALAFSPAFDEINTPDDQTPEAGEIAGTAVLFLKTASFLFPEAIPLEIFTEILSAENERGAELSQDEIFLDKVFAKIARFDLFEKDKDANTFDIHRLVQLVVFNKIEPDEKLALGSRILEILRDLFPKYDYFNKEACERYFRQTETALKNAGEMNLQNEISVSLYDRTARYQELLGNFAQAEIFYKRNLVTSKIVFGENDKETATSLNNLASVYYSQGRYDEAIELYEQAFLIDEKTIGKEHPDYATRLNNLALVYRSQGRYDEAIELYNQALLIGEKTIGKEHPDYATRLNNLALVYKSQGRYDEAIKLYNQALLIDEKTIGKEHPAYAVRLNNLAMTYRSQGRYNEAIELFNQALLIGEQTIGKAHPAYALRLNNQAEVYRLQGRYDEAVELCEKALLIYEKTIGKLHPDYATNLNNLALVYDSQGRYDEAIELYKQALLIDEQTIGKAHPEHARHLNNLAGVYRSQGRYDEAIELYKQALLIDEKTIGKEHPDYAVHLNNLAGVYVNQGKYKIAEELIDEAKQIRENALGKEHPDTANTYWWIADLLDKQEKYEEALPMYEETLRIFIKFLGENHPDTQTVKGNLESCRAKMEQ